MCIFSLLLLFFFGAGDAPPTGLWGAGLVGEGAFLLRPSAYVQALREFDPTNGFSVEFRSSLWDDLNSPLLSLCVFLASVAGIGQEYKDGQFYKTPRAQEPNSYAITSTWRHHDGINQHHHALKLTPGEMLDDHDCAHN